MKKYDILEAIGNVDAICVQKARKHVPSKRIWLTIGSLAACVALLVALPMTLRGFWDSGHGKELSLNDLNRPYKNVSLWLDDGAVAWKWEQMTTYERYMSIVIDGVEFVRLGRDIDCTQVGDKVGTYEAIGDNEPYETPAGGYRAWFDVYKIKNVASSNMLAVKMEDNYYAFISNVARGNLSSMSFGDMLNQYGLAKSVAFARFSQCINGRETNYFALHDDAYIWNVLQTCQTAPAIQESAWKKEKKHLSFTVTSDVYGVYKKVWYVSEDGYIWTNFLDVACVYHIGTEAAGQIITYAMNHADKVEPDMFHKTVAGTITAITDDYILVDDSILCKNPSDGITFKILLNDLRITRYMDVYRFKVGDVVQVAYEDTITQTKEYKIDSAVSIIHAEVADDEVLVPE